MSNEPWKPSDDLAYSVDQWREIDRFPGFRFTHDGFIWSCWTLGCQPRIGSSWKRIKACDSGNGYLRVVLRDIENRRRSLWAHRLIAEAFLGSPPHGQEVRHFPDHNRTNNCVANLRYGTRADNCADCKLHGRNTQGDRHPLAKLSTHDVLRIRTLHNEDGTSVRDLAEMFGISRSQVYRLVSRQSWSDVR